MKAPSLERLPKAARTAVAAARAVARRRGVRLYLAGGIVRDLLSGQPARDVDLVIEADETGAADFVRDLARELSAAARPHDRFGTAVLTLPDGERLDVAAARRETYATPGALPTVAFPAGIEEDLARRDFTVNAMALALSPGRRPRLVDPYGGAGDLERGTLRALHSASFVDDPTRALRAVRYANRYGFRLDAATRRAIARAVEGGAFARVSGDRIRRELVKLFGEPRRAAAVRLLRRLGLDRAIAPNLARVRGHDARLRLQRVEVLAPRERGAGWLAVLLAWVDGAGLSGAALRSVADRLALAGDERGRLLAWPSTRRRLGRGLARRPVSEIAGRIAGLSPDESLAVAAGLSPADRRALANARRRLAQHAQFPRGADLIAAGVAPGVAVGRALARTRDALLDGRISRREALAFALLAARRVAARPVAARRGTARRRSP